MHQRSKKGTLMKWSRVGDIAWRIGMEHLAGLAYSRAMEQAEREHAEAAHLPMKVGLVVCRNPACLWEAQYSHEDEETLREISHAYAVHPCPITEEDVMCERDEDEE